MNKFLIVAVATLFTVGCASKSDLKAVQNQVDALQVNLKDVRDTVNEAQAAANKAVDSANKANIALENIGDKLDRAFRKGALK